MLALLESLRVIGSILIYVVTINTQILHRTLVCTGWNTTSRAQNAQLIYPNTLRMTNWPAEYIHFVILGIRLSNIQINADDPRNGREM